MAISPVIHATEYMIRLNKELECPRQEGLDLCSKLIDWISTPDRPDYHEAAMLSFFLAHTMRQRRVITAKRFHQITDQAATVIQQACASKMDRAMADYLKDRGYTCQETTEMQEECPSTDALLKIAKLKENESPSTQDKVELLNLFERLVHWASVTPQKSFYEETEATDVFLVGDHMFSKGLITPVEKQLMDQRAFQVFVRYPDHTIVDDDLVDHLHLSLKFEIEKIPVKKSPAHATLKYTHELDKFSLFQLQDPRYKKKGLKQYSKLIWWLSRINRSDYQSVAEQTFTLLDVMKNKGIISEQDAAKLVDQTGRVILNTLGTKMNAEMSAILSQRGLKASFA